jgi:hypothetical protein
LRNPKSDSFVAINPLEYYLQLCELCALSNFDIEDVPNADKDAKINGSMWSLFYHHVYRKHLDRYITYIFVGLSGLTLCAGVAEALKTWYYIGYLYHPNAGAIWLYILMVACASPVGLVWTGRKIVHYATHHALKCRQQIELAMQTGPAGPASASAPTNANVVLIETAAQAQ